MSKIKAFICTAAAIWGLASTSVVVSAQDSASESFVKPNPVISRNCPAYSGSGQASAGNDEHYFSFWTSSSPDYLAYDLSEVSTEMKKEVNAVWYNMSAFDNIGSYANQSGIPTEYTIEVNSADGGSYPEEGWEVAEKVSGNKLASRQHTVSMEGYNWLRINVSESDGAAGKPISMNFDIHSVTEGVSDSWLFLGDSITAGGMNNCFGTGFATYVNRIDSRYFPAQENGGIGGIRSIEGKENIDEWLSVSGARFVSIAYGTNDAWGNPNAADAYYENTKYMIDAIIAAGKVPVLPKIPYSTNSDVAPNVPLYNAKVEALYEEYGDKLIKGPDFYAYFEEHQDNLSDGVHPDSEGYDAMRQLWAETMYKTVYTAESQPAEVSGDINGDGEFNTADLTALSKWVLGLSDSKPAKWRNGDLVKDDVLNVYDAIAMRRKLILSVV